MYLYRNACFIWDSSVLLVALKEFIKITANATRLFVTLKIGSSSANNLIVPNKLVTFAEDDQYVSSLAGEPNSPWNVLAPRRFIQSSFVFLLTLVAAGKGFIKVISPATWGLYGGYPVDDGTGSDTESYCISMYHQLHCLVRLIDIP